MRTKPAALPTGKNLWEMWFSYGSWREKMHFGQHLVGLCHIYRGQSRFYQFLTWTSSVPLESSQEVSTTLFSACCNKGIYMPALTLALFQKPWSSMSLYLCLWFTWYLSILSLPTFPFSKSSKLFIFEDLRQCWLPLLTSFWWHWRQISS